MAIVKWMQKVFSKIKDGLRLRRVVRRCYYTVGFKGGAIIDILFSRKFELISFGNKLYRKRITKYCKADILQAVEKEII